MTRVGNEDRRRENGRNEARDESRCTTEDHPEDRSENDHAALNADTPVTVQVVDIIHESRSDEEVTPAATHVATQRPRMLTNKRPPPHGTLWL